MPKAKVTKGQIIKVASALVKRGINPTVLNIREQLGAGSTSTINKYLRQWKQEKLSEKPTKALLSSSPELEQLKSDLKQQQKINQQLLQELYNVQQENVLQQSEISKYQELEHKLQQEQKKLSSQYNLLEAKYTELCAERETALKVFVADKEQQIKSLQEELLTVNKNSKQELLDGAGKQQDALLAEKVKLINLEVKVKQLQHKLQAMQTEKAILLRDKSALQIKLNTLQGTGYG